MKNKNESRNKREPIPRGKYLTRVGKKPSHAFICGVSSEYTSPFSRYAKRMRPEDICPIAGRTTIIVNRQQANQLEHQAELDATNDMAREFMSEPKPTGIVGCPYNPSKALFNAIFDQHYISPILYV